MNNAILPLVTAQYFVVFQLILFRLFAFCVVVPYMGSRMIPKKVSLFFAAGIAFVLSPRIYELYPINIAQVDLTLAIIENFVVGFVYGISLLLVFELISLVGTLIAYASGMGMLQMIDPSSGGNSGVFSKLIGVTFGIIFISSGGLLVFIDFIGGSFGAFPIIGMHIDGDMFFMIVKEFKNILSMGVMISIPFTCAALLLNIALAVVSKSAPAMNLFSIGFPLTVLLGIVALSFVMPTLISDIYTYVLNLKGNYQSIL